MRFILRGRRSIWCSWMVTTDAPRIVLCVAYVMLINHAMHFLVAGAGLGEVGGRLLMLREVYWTFHM